MNEIFEFSKTASPMVLLALCLVIILMLLLGNEKFTLINIFRSKDTGIKPSLSTITKQLEKIAGNHLHELPEMKVTLDKIREEQIEQGNRLTKVETKVDILLKP